jgi:DNA-binding response OmpR family regulator
MPLTKILYVEDNYTLRQFVKDVFDLAGWYVHYSSDDVSARIFLKSKERYDLLLIDNELTHCNSGLELVKLARVLPQRKQTPIILFSLEDCAREAQRAGSNAFLRKPTDIHLLVDTVKRLLSVTPL